MIRCHQSHLPTDMEIVLDSQKRRFPHLPGQMILLAPVKIHFKFETPNIFSLAESYSDPRQCGLKRGN